MAAESSTPTVSPDSSHAVHVSPTQKGFLGGSLFGRKYSPKQLAVFAIVFAAIGVFFIWRSFAAQAVVATVEAETLTPLPAGVATNADSTASGGRAIRFTTQATAPGSVPLPSQVTSVTVSAKANQCGGASTMTIKVDGNAVQTATVGSSVWGDYSTANLNLAAGNHSLSAEFTNPYTKYRANHKVTCRRDLALDKLTFYGPDSGDTTKPTAPALSGKPGDQQAVLTWTPATDDVGVTRYEIWYDRVYVTGLPATARTYTATGLVNGSAYNFRVVAYDAAGNYENSVPLPVTITPQSGAVSLVNPAVSVGCPNGASPAAFPSRLKTSGRNLVDENGCVMPTMKGFNIHCATVDSPSYTYPQSEFDDIYAKGGRVLRTVVQWGAYEPTKGTINQTALNSLALHIQRAAADHDPNTPGVQGMYVMLELHLNVEGVMPHWKQGDGVTSNGPFGTDDTDKYVKYDQGRLITQTLASLYANNKTVIGFGLNEPPQAWSVNSGNQSIPTFESQQRTMINWFRTQAPSWIGFVTLAYANQTPYLADPNKQDADPHAYDAGATSSAKFIAPAITVPGNVVFDIHDYFAYNDNEDPNTDSRQYNSGNVDDTSHGGTAHMFGLGDPHTYVSTPTHISQMKSFLAPFNTYADAAQMPLMVGEFGWNLHNGTGCTSTTSPCPKRDWYADTTAAMKATNIPIQMQWIYGQSTTDEWASNPAGVWDQDILTWLRAQ